MTQLIQRYEEEMALVRGGAAWTGLVLLLGALAALPWLLPGYYVYILNFVGINVIVAIGLNLLVGYTGQVSPGHVGFVAIGAYAATHFIRATEASGVVAALGGPFWMAGFIRVAAAAGGGAHVAVVRVLVGPPARRLEGPYLAIVTLGFGAALQQLLSNWPAVAGGRIGRFAPQPALGSFVLGSARSLYYLVWTVVLGMSL